MPSSVVLPGQTERPSSATPTSGGSGWQATTNSESETRTKAARMPARSAEDVPTAIARNDVRARSKLRTAVSNFADDRDQGRCAPRCYFIFAARRFTCVLSQTLVDALTATK